MVQATPRFLATEFIIAALEYRPDILAIKSENDGYIIEIKNKSTNISVDQFRDIAEAVAQHAGWHFLLVTGDDISQSESAQENEKLLSWEQIVARKEMGDRLLKFNDVAGAFITFWGLVEAMMRTRAEQVSIPIERFPTTSLIKHLYSQGELSIEQFDKIMELLKIRNQIVHGFSSQTTTKEVTDLGNLVSELLESWHPEK